MVFYAGENINEVVVNASFLSRYMTEIFVLQCSDSYLESKPWVSKKQTKNKQTHCE